jgi:hypothetical protein
MLPLGLTATQQDVGTALGVSFQRAKQLIDEADKLAR